MRPEYVYVVIASESDYELSDTRLLAAFDSIQEAHDFSVEAEAQAKKVDDKIAAWWEKHSTDEKPMPKWVSERGTKLDPTRSTPTRTSYGVVRLPLRRKRG